MLYSQTTAQLATGRAYSAGLSKTRLGLTYQIIDKPNKNFITTKDLK